MTGTVDDRKSYHRIILNFPPELASRVKDMAEQERRPLSRQIQILVERALALEVAGV